MRTEGSADYVRYYRCPMETINPTDTYNSFLQPRARKIWRVVIVCFICLPLGLSTAYKRLFGGESTAQIYPGINGRQYGFSPSNSAVLTGGSEAFYLNSTSDLFQETSCFLGVYNPSTTFWNEYYSNASKPEVLSFRNYIFQFTTRRHVTKVSISLLDGGCPPDTEPIDSAMFSAPNSNQFAPFPLDSLPVLAHSLGSRCEGYCAVF